jgi:anti-sigma B factor antagonist
MSVLKIQHRRNGQVAILDLDGRITLGEDSVTLRENVRGLLASGEKQILINLEKVGYVDSSGLGEIVSAYSTAVRQGATLKLANLTQRVTGLLQMTKLLTIFETFDTENDAIASFETGTVTSTSR